MRLLLLMNSKSGSSDNKKINLLEFASLLNSHEIEIAMPDSPEGAERAARAAVDAGYERLIVFGGDGTIDSVLPALAGSATALGVLPAGTANVLARELQLPMGVKKGLEIALNGTPRKIDLGLANGKYFALMAGLGFDAQVVSRVVPELKKIFGPLAYVTSGLQSLSSYPKSNYKITMDDYSATFPAWLIIVGNATTYGYELAISPESRIDDGLLDVCVFGEQSALDRVTQLLATAIGLHSKHPNVTIFRTKSIRISANPSVKYQLDGDQAGDSPVEISVQPGALTVMTPNKMQYKL